MAAIAGGLEQHSDSKPQPYHDYEVLDRDIPRSEAETRLDALFASNTNPAEKFPDQTICEISSLLRILEPSLTSPRVYIVLRSIGHLEKLGYFTENGITDLWFPFRNQTIPAALDKSMRLAFLDRQQVVLTKSIDLEIGVEGKHQYFGSEDVVPFEAQGLLGVGTFGVVDRVKSTLTGSVYARKRIKRSDRRSMHRKMEIFEKEVLAMKRLQHQHVVKLVGSYTDPVYAAFIVSPVADSNLKDFLDATAADPTLQALSTLRSFFGCLANGLEYMHRRLVRHKDIKPMNILVKGKSVLYTDFGIAFDWADAGKSTTQDTIPAMTRVYSAPEMLTDAPRNSAADMWSLGCVFAEILLVLRGSSVLELKEFLKEYGTKSPIYALNKDGLETFLCKCLAREGLPSEEEAFDWIESMLQSVPRHRPTAEVLLEMTESLPGFTGDCCNGSQPSMSLERGDQFKRQIEPQGPGDMQKVPLDRLHTADEDLPISLEDSIISTPSTATLVPVEGTHDGSASNETTAKAPQGPLTRAHTSSESASKVEPTKSSGLSIPSLVKAPIGRKATPSLNSLKASFFGALHKGDLQSIQDALDKGVNINTADHSGETATMKAASKGDVTVLSFLLRRGPDLDLQDSFGYTALHETARRSRSDAMELLINAGAGLNVRTSEKSGLMTPLYQAASRDASCVGKLISAGADVSLKTAKGYTPLSTSAATGKVDVVKMLLSAGAEVNSRDNEGWTPLHQSARNGHSAVIDMLIEHGADVHAETTIRHQRPLHFAASKGDAVSVKLLLSAGAIVDAKIDTGYAALHLASSNGHTRVVEMLLDHGASINLKGYNEQTALTRAAHNGRLDTVKLLYKRGAVFTGGSCRSTQGNSPLHHAAEADSEPTVSYLIGLGAKVDARNNAGETPLHLAAKNGYLEPARVLLSHGSEPKSRARKGGTPLDYAISNGHADLVELIEDFVSEETQEEVREEAREAA